MTAFRCARTIEVHNSIVLGERKAGRPPETAQVVNRHHVFERLEAAEAKAP